MSELLGDFEERLSEVRAFVDLVSTVEGLVASSTSAGGVTATLPVSPLQQKVLCAAVYLHLYNLVEATISNCISVLERAATVRSARHFSAGLRSQWARAVARTHEALTPENRLDAALRLLELALSDGAASIKFDAGNGGNWDDEQIYSLAQRFGIALQLRRETEKSVKRPYRDGQGALKSIRSLRNKLAHGQMSFGVCGDGLGAAQLHELTDVTSQYLREVIASFEQYLSDGHYLEPEFRLT